MAATLLGRKYIQDPAYGGTIGFHRVKLNLSPETINVAPIPYTGQVAIISAKDSAGVVLSQSPATSTVTFGAAGTANQTITVLGRVYTINTVPSGTDSFKLGGTAAASAQSFADAINANTANSNLDSGAHMPPKTYYLPNSSTEHLYVSVIEILIESSDALHAANVSAPR